MEKTFQYLISDFNGSLLTVILSRGYDERYVVFRAKFPHRCVIILWISMEGIWTPVTVKPSALQLRNLGFHGTVR